MLKTISKPVMIAMTLMLMSLSPMVGNASATGTEYFEVWEGSSGTMTMDGDTIYLQSGTPLEITEDMFDLEIGDYYDNFFEIEDGSGTLVVDEYESFAANYSQETRFFNNTLLDDCGYEAQVELSHYNDTTGAFDMVNNIMFYVEVGDCNSILADFEDATLDEEVLIVLIPDPEPGEEDQADIFAMSDMKIDSVFRGILDSDGDGDVTESELYFESGLYQALYDDRYPDSGINWTLDGVAGISEGDDVQLHFDLEELLGNTSSGNNAWVQSYLMFNVTGLGGLVDEDTQTLEFEEFRNDGNGMMKVQEYGRNLLVTNVTLNGVGAYYMQEYSTSADATFVCSSEVGGEPDMEIDFYKVNDGTEDCGDGSDEPQDMDPAVDSDGDGDFGNDHDSWFDCHFDDDGVTVNMDLVNDGNWDCNDGEDEGMEYVPASWEIPQDEGTLVLELGAMQIPDIDIFMQSVTSEEIRFLPLDELLVDVVFAFDGDVRAEFDDDGDGHVSSQELNELWSQLEEAMNGDNPDDDDDGKANFTLDGVFHSVDVHFTVDLIQLMGPTDAGNGEAILTFNVITLDTSNDHFIAIEDMEFDGMLCIENTEYFTVGSATWDGVGMGYDSDLQSTCSNEETEGTLEFEIFAINDDTDDGMDNMIDKVDLGFELFNSADGGITVEFEVTIVADDGEEGHANALRMEADNHGDGNGIVNESEADMLTNEFDILNDEKTYWCHEDDDGDPSTEEGYEIAFEQVNDGFEDCTNGEDEPQDMDPAVDSDGDGDFGNDHDSWFDCHFDDDGVTVNMDVVNDGVDDCPNGDDENWDDDFFFFDGVAFNNNYTNIVFSSTGLVGDVDQADDVVITVVYTFEFSDASQDVGHWLELDISDGGDDDGDDDKDDPPTPEEAMNETDADGDGYMSYEEFEAAWNSTDENSTEEDTDAELDWDAVADLFDNCDSDVDDLIDIDEMECFVDGIVDMMSEEGKDDAQDTLDDTDTNGDGYMSYEEFEAKWDSEDDNSTGEDSDPELNWDAVADLFNDCDLDANDLIDIDEMQCFVDGINAMMGESGDEEWYLELFSNTDWNLVNVSYNDNVEDAMIDNGHYGTSVTNDDYFWLSAYFEPCIDIDADNDCDDDTTVDCDADEIWDEDTQSCIPDTTDDCMAGEIWDDDSQSCVDEIIVDCAGVVDGTAYLDADGVCVEENTTVTCGDNETLVTDAAGVEECVENTTVEPVTCPDGEILDPLTNTCVDNPTVADPVDTSPNCDVFYWVGSAGNPTNNWNWTQMMAGWTEFTAPNNGEYTLALPKGDYFVYFGCWDAEGDEITLAVDGLPEIQEFEADESWVWGWDEFSINDEDVGMQHDMVISWSSTDFGGNVTIHFTGVDSLADSVAESDTGGLPGFTASLGLMAMLGAALILARRKD